jgi:hypothetical protein
MGTSSASAMRCNRLAPIRLVPLSVFLDLLKRHPDAVRESVCDKRHSKRRDRTRWATSTSRLSARRADARSMNFDRFTPSPKHANQAVSTCGKKHGCFL